MASNEGSNEHLQLMTQPDPNSQSGANSPNYATTNTAATILSSDLSNAYQAVPATQVVGPPSNLPFGNLNSQPQGNFSISNVSQFGTPYTLATGQQVLQWSEETVNVVTACFSNMRPDDGIPTLARMLSGDLPFNVPGATAPSSSTLPDNFAATHSWLLSPLTQLLMWQMLHPDGASIRQPRERKLITLLCRQSANLEQLFARVRQLSTTVLQLLDDDNLIHLQAVVGPITPEYIGAQSQELLLDLVGLTLFWSECPSGPFAGRDLLNLELSMFEIVSASRPISSHRFRWPSTRTPARQLAARNRSRSRVRSPRVPRVSFNEDGSPASPPNQSGSLPQSQGNGSGLTPVSQMVLSGMQASQQINGATAQNQMDLSGMQPSQPDIGTSLQTPNASQANNGSPGQALNLAPVMVTSQPTVSNYQSAPAVNQASATQATTTQATLPPSGVTPGNTTTGTVLGEPPAATSGPGLAPPAAPANHNFQQPNNGTHPSNAPGGQPTDRSSRPTVTGFDGRQHEVRSDSLDSHQHAPYEYGYANTWHSNYGRSHLNNNYPNSSCWEQAGSGDTRPFSYGPSGFYASNSEGGHTEWPWGMPELHTILEPSWPPSEPAFSLLFSPLTDSGAFIKGGLRLEEAIDAGASVSKAKAYLIAPVYRYVLRTCFVHFIKRSCVEPVVGDPRITPFVRLAEGLPSLFSKFQWLEEVCQLPELTNNTSSDQREALACLCGSRQLNQDQINALWNRIAAPLSSLNGGLTYAVALCMLNKVNPRSADLRSKSDFLTPFGKTQKGDELNTAFLVLQSKSPPEDFLSITSVYYKNGGLSEAERARLSRVISTLKKTISQIRTQFSGGLDDAALLWNEDSIKSVCEFNAVDLALLTLKLIRPENHNIAEMRPNLSRILSGCENLSNKSFHDQAKIVILSFAKGPGPDGIWPSLSEIGTNVRQSAYCFQEWKPKQQKPPTTYNTTYNYDYSKATTTVTTPATNPNAIAVKNPADEYLPDDAIAQGLTMRSYAGKVFARCNEHLSTLTDDQRKELVKKNEACGLTISWGFKKGKWRLGCGKNCSLAVILGSCPLKKCLKDHPPIQAILPK